MDDMRHIAAMTQNRFGRSLDVIRQARARFRADHFKGNPQLPPILAIQEAPDPLVFRLHRCSIAKDAWVPQNGTPTTGMSDGATLRVFSFDMHFRPGSTNGRSNMVLENFKDVCGDSVSSTVVLLQAVDQESLHTIMQDEWVQQHFNSSTITPPPLLERRINQYGFIRVKATGTPVKSFTMILASKDVPVLDTFRVPWLSKPGHDVLAVDVLLSPSTPQSEKPSVLRICTTNFEYVVPGATSLYEPELAQRVYSHARSSHCSQGHDFQTHYEIGTPR